MNRIGNKQLVRAEVILERLAAFRLSKRLRSTVEVFRQSDADYLSSVREIAQCRAELRSRGAIVHAADAALDSAVGELADSIVGARLGKRRNPFAAFSPYRPFRLTQLAYATELRAVRSLLERVERIDPPKGLMQVVVRCREKADRVDEALRALSGPRARHQRAVSQLPGIVEYWRKALQRLKIEVTAHWVEDPATRAAIFARPEAIQRPVKRKRAKKVTAPVFPVATRA